MNEVIYYYIYLNLNILIRKLKKMNTVKYKMKTFKTKLINLKIKILKKKIIKFKIQVNIK